MTSFDKNIKFVDKSIFIKKEKILVLADVHIGYEEALNKQGILIPRTQFKETIENINKIISKIKTINKIVILGDLKHEFGSISSQEWKETIKFLEILMKKTKNIILIKGNHDTILGPISNKKNIQIKDFYKLKNYLFIHGNKPFLDNIDKSTKYIFIGHIHPAISLRENSKVEKYKCFLIAGYKNKKIIILPSLMPILEGLDISQNNIKIANEFSPSKFDIYAIEDKIYYFGQYKNNQP